METTTYLTRTSFMKHISWCQKLPEHSENPLLNGNENKNQTIVWKRESGSRFSNKKLRKTNKKQSSIPWQSQ